MEGYQCKVCEGYLRANFALNDVCRSALTLHLPAVASPGLFRRSLQKRRPPVYARLIVACKKIYYLHIKCGKPWAAYHNPLWMHTIGKNVRLQILWIEGIATGAHYARSCLAIRWAGSTEIGVETDLAQQVGMV